MNRPDTLTLRKKIVVLEQALRRCEQAIGYLNPKILELGAGKLAELNSAAEAALAALATTADTTKE